MQLNQLTANVKNAIIIVFISDAAFGVELVPYFDTKEIVAQS